jgi:hypothetical protein
MIITTVASITPAPELLVVSTDAETEEEELSFERQRLPIRRGLMYSAGMIRAAGTIESISALVEKAEIEKEEDVQLSIKRETVENAEDSPEAPDNKMRRTMMIRTALQAKLTP